MANFKKAMRFKIISLTLSILFLFNSQLYPYSFSKEMLRPPSSFENQKLKERIKNAEKVIASNAGLYRRQFLIAAAAPFTVSTAAVFKTQGSTLEDNMFSYLNKLGYSAGYPSKLIREMAKQIINLNDKDILRDKGIAELLKNNTVQSLLSLAMEGEVEPLLDFFRNLKRVLERKRVIGLSENPHRLMKLLAADEDVFDVIDNVRIQDNREKFILKNNITDCVPVSILINSSAISLGIKDARIAITHRHSFNVVPLGGTLYLFTDNSLNIFRVIDLSIYYDTSDEKHWVLKRKISEDRLLFLRSEYNAMSREGESDAVSLLISKHKVTDEELLNLFYPIIEMPDMNNFVFIAHLNLGKAYSSSLLRQFERAKKEFKKAERLNPSSDQVYSKWGVFYLEQGDSDTALKAFEKALLINSNNPEAHLNLGVMYILKKEWARAVTELESGIKLGYYDDPKAYSNLGLAYFHLEDDVTAIGAYSKALKLDPNDADSHYGIAAAYYNLGKLEEAVKHFTEAVKLNRGFLDSVPDRIRQQVAKEAGIDISESLAMPRIAVTLKFLERIPFTDI